MLGIAWGRSLDHSAVRADSDALSMRKEAALSGGVSVQMQLLYISRFRLKLVSSHIRFLRTAWTVIIHLTDYDAKTTAGRSSSKLLLNLICRLREPRFAVLSLIQVPLIVMSAMDSDSTRAAAGSSRG